MISKKIPLGRTRDSNVLLVSLIRIISLRVWLAIVQHEVYARVDRTVPRLQAFVRPLPLDSAKLIHGPFLVRMIAITGSQVGLNARLVHASGVDAHVCANKLNGSASVMPPLLVLITSSAPIPQLNSIRLRASRNLDDNISRIALSHELARLFRINQEMFLGGPIVAFHVHPDFVVVALIM